MCGDNGTHTTADLAEILRAQGNRCAYCKVDLKQIKKQVDHIVPLVRGGSNGRSNLQYLCQPCNNTKSAKDPVDFAQSIGLLL
jgi:5-methylcytosine-specific restriction endonuclease McrA